jgi:uncharacterized protein (TIGR03437 family)
MALSATLMPGTAPTVPNGAVLQAAALVPGAPVAPGSIISIFGSNLADSQGMEVTQVSLGKFPLPLTYEGTGQLNAQVPFGVPLNTQSQLSVRRGTVLSPPLQLVITDVQPGIFTTDLTGTGPGVIYNSDGTLAQHDDTRAVTGGTVLIYCTGLGEVTPLKTTVNTVTVTIGGVNAPVTFAGMVNPFLSTQQGLYQITAIVPDIVPEGSDAGASDTVPVTLTVKGHASPAVTIKRPKGGTPHNLTGKSPNN